MELKLNIGCGNDIREGYINVDHIPLEGVDIVHDINSIPLPFEEESVSLVVCLDTLEHVNYIDIVGEFCRIL